MIEFVAYLLAILSALIVAALAGAAWARPVLRRRRERRHHAMKRHRRFVPDPSKSR